MKLLEWKQQQQQKGHTFQLQHYLLSLNVTQFRPKTHRHTHVKSHAVFKFNFHRLAYEFPFEKNFTLCWQKGNTLALTSESVYVFALNRNENSKKRGKEIKCILLASGKKVRPPTSSHDTMYVCVCAMIYIRQSNPIELFEQKLFNFFPAAGADGFICSLSLSTVRQTMFTSS